MTVRPSAAGSMWTDSGRLGVLRCAPESKYAGAAALHIRLIHTPWPGVEPASSILEACYHIHQSTMAGDKCK